MPCNSTGGGGAAYAANTGSQTTLDANSPWPAGNVDGFVNYGKFSDTSAQQLDDIMGDGNNGTSDQWWDDLTSQEIKGVKWYTGSGFVPMNEYLREGGPVFQGDLTAIQQTESALKEGVLDVPTVMHRGGSNALVNGATTVQQLQAMAGQIVTDKGFMSSSPSASGAWHDDIFYHIKTPAGKGIGAYVGKKSSNPYEHEFLYQRSSSFRVLGGYEDSEGHIHCNMEYIGNDL